MNRSALALIAVLIVLIAGTVYISQRVAEAPLSGEESAAARTLVTEFGTKLAFVPLLATSSERAAAMQLYYGPYVAPELIAAWSPEGAEGALGRYTSSPAPERIEVVEVRKTSPKSFVVEANIIETTRTGSTTTEVAAVQPVTFALEKRDGKLLIVKAYKGAYSEVPHRQTLVGYWECLPHKDTAGPQTTECALGIAVDQSDGHYALDLRLMERYPVDYPTGTKLRVEGIVTPSNQLSSMQKYDIDGIIAATSIEKL